METDPQTCPLASGPQGGRPHGDGCDVMKRGGEGGAHLGVGCPQTPRTPCVLAEVDAGAALPFLTFGWKGRAFFEAREVKGSLSPALGLAPQSQAQNTVCLSCSSPCLCGYFSAVLTTWCNYMWGTFKTKHNSRCTG